MFENILCATDGSSVSQQASTFALKIAKEMGQAVTFINASTVSSESVSKSMFWDSDVLEVGDAMTKAAFRDLEEKAKKLGVENVKYVSVSGKNISDAIVGFAEEHKHDHIIVGSHGETGIRALMLGSVTQNLLAKTNIPVTVVR